MNQINSQQFFLGCAVWAYKNWVGDLFPAGSRPTDFLSLYSHRFTTVEGNTTFYAVPDLKTIHRWKDQTPAEFKFCLKFPRNITHKGRLQPQISAALNFLEKMQGLGSRLGPFFAQLPPSYSPELKEDLNQFLEAISNKNIKIALEVRHPDWFTEPHQTALNQFLKELGIGRVLLDSRPVYLGENDPQLHSERRKPQLPVQFNLTSSFTLIRFISHPTLSVNQPFLEEWLTQIQQWLSEGTQIYFFVHCPVEDHSPRTARHFQSLLEQQNISIPPLPWNLINQPPTQLDLW
ncbi:MAG: DUF72 domain-containing protein [Microcoleaceae cyanobacterium]